MRLPWCARSADHLAVVAQMVAVVVVPAYIAAYIPLVQLAVAAREEVLAEYTIHQCEAAQIVDGVFRQNLTGRQLVRLAAPHGDAWNGGVVDGTQLAACGRIGILRDVAVGELDTAGHAVVVVLNKSASSLT